MKNFLKVMLGCVFTVLIACSVQPVLAYDVTDMFKPVPIKGSEYQFHLQVILRDSDGRLMSVTESTNGYYIPHDITDEGFDNCFGSNICKKEIVVVDNKKYEKIQYKEKYSLDLPQRLMFFITAILEVSYGPETVIADAGIFQAFVPLVYLEDDTMINTQWTILRELN